MYVDYPYFVHISLTPLLFSPPIPWRPQRPRRIWFRTVWILPLNQPWLDSLSGQSANWMISSSTLTKVRVDNLHYDITETDLEVRFQSPHQPPYKNTPNKLLRWTGSLRPNWTCFWAYCLLRPRWTLWGSCFCYIRPPEGCTHLHSGVWRSQRQGPAYPAFSRRGPPWP